MRRIAAWLAVLAAALFAVPALADGTAAQQSEMAAAVAEVTAAVQAGPQKIAIAGQARLDLPAGYGFVPAGPAGKLLKAMGNRPGDDLAGLILPAGDGDNWFMVVRYVASGYIKDDDARDWKADELLTSMREGTEQGNAERRQRGLPEIEVVGWVEAPRYEAASHRLVWSVSSRAKGSPAATDDGINYNTLALGREGYVSMNLVTGLKEVEAQKPIARSLLAALEFDDGKRYADFNSSTDKVAEYGLAALVAGVAAKKLGFFALAAAFLAKFAKIIGIAVIAGGAGLLKLFRRNKGEAADTDRA